MQTMPTIASKGCPRRPLLLPAPAHSLKGSRTVDWRSSSTPAAVRLAPRTGGMSLLCKSADVAEVVVVTELSAAEQQAAHRNILIAVDDSDASERACDWAIENLYRQGDVLHLFHVIPVPMPQVVGGGLAGEVTFITPDPREDVSHIEYAKEMIHTRFVPKASARDIPFKIEMVRFGTGNDAIGEAVCKRAQNLSAVAVVIASNNKGAIQEMFLGSVTNYVTHHCKQPVLVMHI